MLAIFGLGMMELLIVAVIGGCMLLVPVIVVIAILVSSKSGTPAAELAPCPHCGALTPAHSSFCGKCGKPLG
jgi:hypothetical protein